MRLILIFVMAFIVSCTSFNDRERRVSVRRDVPFQARSNPMGEPRMRVMILPVIDVEKTSSPKVAQYARDVLVKKLIQTDQFIIIQNSDFGKDVNTYLTNDAYNLEQMARDAKGMGIAAIIEAKIVRIKAHRIGDEVGLIRKVKARMDTTIAIRMVGTENQRDLMNETRSAVIEDSTTRFGAQGASERLLREDPQLVRLSVSRAFESMVPPIVKSIQKLSWEGRIAEITGDQIYVNAGRISGIQVGDILKVVEIGQDIYDPQSGEFLGHAPGRMKGTLEVVSYFGKDGAITVTHSGGGFKAADRVEIY